MLRTPIPARNRSASCRIPWTANPKAKRVDACFRSDGQSLSRLLGNVDGQPRFGITSKIDPGPAMDKDLYDLPPKELKKIPTVCGSLREALTNLDAEGPRLPQSGQDVFNDDFIDSYY